MQAPVEVRYAGIVVGRAQDVRSDEDPSIFFLPGKEPMPVGTVVQLRSGDRETSARVLRAVESADPAVAGMKVRLIGESEAVLPDWIPSPAPAPVKTSAKGGTPTPAVEVNLGLMQTYMPEAPAVLDAVKLAPPPEPVAAPVPAPAPVAAEPEPVAAAPAPEPVAAAPEPAPVPEAVPVAVGSSLTGALEQAAEGAPATAENAAEAANGDAGNGASETTAGESPATEDMPAARPIAGPSGRRKTKRRR